ncbi:MAG TPA: class I SAM-dependent methyltransferase [Methylomirabilota bacterium]|nr:class I SAM-dependent methyltransferase [Methylomirabilota bacterium]
MDPIDTDAVIQRVQLELYRDNLEGALEIVERAYEVFPSPRYSAQAARIRAWLGALQNRAVYAAAYEHYYRTTKRGFSPRHLERWFRTLTGRRTRKLVTRRAARAEFLLLELDVLGLGAHRVLDAGCGEGHVALTLASRHPRLSVEGLDVSATNVRIARRLNRFPNCAFHEGLIEEADRHFAPDSFDLVYAFGVLEHVWDVGETVSALLKALRPGGRLCLVVPMVELTPTGPLPGFTPAHTACHVRAFTETALTELFGSYPDFALLPLTGRWRPERYPATLTPRRFGSYFIAFSRP